MEDMRQCVTDANERKYGLWILKDDDTAVRSCKCCGIDFCYPVTKSVLAQMKKQYEALPLLQSFLNLSLDDPNLIGYLNVVLEDVVDYIDDEPKLKLNAKLQELSLTSYITDENKMLIEKFRSAMMSGDNDLFFDTMEIFQEYNIECLTNFIETKKNVTK